MTSLFRMARLGVAGVGVMAACAGSASAATVGFTLVISGAANTPSMLLTNDSDSALLTGFSLTIGDTDYNFDAFNSLPSNPAGGTAVGNTPDTNNLGAIRSDLIDISYTGFNPGETSSWIVDVDVDSDNTVEDYRTVLFNNGSVANAVATALFSGGGVLSLTLSDGGVSQPSYTFSASSVLSEVPLPAALPMLASAMVLAGFAARRKKHDIGA